MIIKNKKFNNFLWNMYKNSYFSKYQLLHTPNIEEEDEIIINLGFPHFLRTCKYSPIKYSDIAKFDIRFLDEYNSSNRKEEYNEKKNA